MTDGKLDLHGAARRRFLSAGLKTGLVTGFGAGLVRPATAGEGQRQLSDRLPPWMRQAGAPFSSYGQPSSHEDGVIRWVSANRDMPGNGASWCPLHELEGIVTPNGLHFERHHNGVPAIDPARHRLLVHGAVDRSLSFRIEDLLRYPLRSRVCFLECGGNSNPGWNRQPSQGRAGYTHGLVSCSEWTGVPLATVLGEAGLQSGADWLIAEGADAFAMNVSIPLRPGWERGLLALYQNGERLRPENGYPLRLILPGWEGVLNVKWLRRLHVADRPAMVRNETAKYTELLPSGKARQFTHTMEVKSLITRPSAGMRLPGPGLYALSGLAWSGNGRIRRVEVSVDGGDTWREAALEEPVLPYCFTRFRLPWRWGGGVSRIASRAVDETGAVQPTRAELIARRGRHGFFHYHAIVTWEIDEEGSVGQVYDRRSDAPDGELDIDAGWF